MTTAWLVKTGVGSPRKGAGSPRMDGLVGQDGGGFAHDDGLGQDVELDNNIEKGEILCRT